jgi:hypothetical protein
MSVMFPEAEDAIEEKDSKPIRWGVIVAVTAALIVALLLWSGPARSAVIHTSPVTVCETAPLPGAANTLNPNAPPDQRRQQLLRACTVVEVPDPTHALSPYQKITDFKHDPRAFT